MPVKGAQVLTPAEHVNIFAPELSSIGAIRDQFDNDKRLFLFYYRGKEQKDPEGATTLWKYVKEAKKKNFPLRQWNTQGSRDSVDFFEKKYEIKGGMGVIIYRDGRYLTSVRDIRKDENKKFEDFKKVLDDFKGRPVRPSPKAFRLEKEAKLVATAKEKADKEKADKENAKTKVEPVEQEAECCVIL